MDMNEYQRLARSTAKYPEQYKLVYPALGLAGESGEVAEKVKKILRDANGEVTRERRAELLKEVGDVLWYVANVAYDLDADLETIAELNISKLSDRANRGTIQGDGDNR